MDRAAIGPVPGLAVLAVMGLYVLAWGSLALWAFWGGTGTDSDDDAPEGWGPGSGIRLGDSAGLRQTAAHNATGNCSMGFFDMFTGRKAPPGRTPRQDAAEIRAAFLALNRDTAPFTLREGGPEGADLVAEWRIVDAAWYEIFAKAGLRKGAQVLLRLDEASGEVRAVDRDYTVEWRAGVPRLAFSADVFPRPEDRDELRHRLRLPRGGPPLRQGLRVPLQHPRAEGPPPGDHGHPRLDLAPGGLRPPLTVQRRPLPPVAAQGRAPFLCATPISKDHCHDHADRVPRPRRRPRAAPRPPSAATACVPSCAGSPPSPRSTPPAAASRGCRRTCAATSAWATSTSSTSEPNGCPAKGPPELDEPGRGFAGKSAAAAKAVDIGRHGVDPACERPLVGRNVSLQAGITPKRA